ncbi:MAG TPA: hypothetical protein VNI58_06640 [Mariprofundaceae bacterium]|nr:hypothetical protein [Mariprofundaceae bacterium]
MLEDFEIQITCSRCGAKTRKPIKWIRKNDELLCGCGEHIALDAEQFKSEIASIAKALADFERSLKRAGH